VYQAHYGSENPPSTPSKSKTDTRTRRGSKQDHYDVPSFLHSFHPISSHLFLLPLLPPKSANISPSALRTLCNSAAPLLCILGYRIRHIAERARRRAAFGVLTVAFGAVDTLFACVIANWLRQSAFANLTRHEIVYAVLEVIDLLVAGDFGLAERICLSWKSETVSRRVQRGS
jgi:hypothetical protein